MSIPITSSITTWRGSVLPKCRSATLPAIEPSTKSATIAAACTQADAGSTIHSSQTGGGAKRARRDRHVTDTKYGGDRQGKRGRELF